MVEASPTRTGAAAAQGNSPTFIPNSMNTRTNPVPMSNYGNEFESYLISALNDSLIRKSKYGETNRQSCFKKRKALLHYPKYKV